MKPSKPIAQSTLDRLGPTADSLGLNRKAFPLAPGSSIAAVVIRELSSYDDDEIARALTLSPDTSMLYAGKIMKREALRRAIVGYWPKVGAEYVEAQQPFEGIDKYTLPTMRQLGEFFEILNGVDEDDLKKAVGAATEWRPGDGAPIWPGVVALDDSTGSE